MRKSKKDKVFYVQTTFKVLCKDKETAENLVRGEMEMAGLHWSDNVKFADVWEVEETDLESLEES